ncbi:YjzC family protein [Pseudenhygromyxa sp. WMMC2535]|uniref:YjzC family protein n=1 Tax=Pseudenhygromyxa sp. WMMC2535 TaxID=2712867 RepID=UPI001554C6CA|nr:YjzC family protein [Pseudenhygromyxa sp. WMMC2535]NVB40911.1 YjzC family protein [Pseudenhygromyxa sp. WMMC2535]
MSTLYKTSDQCATSGQYAFKKYVDGTTTPSPTQEERVIPLTRGETFPPIRSCNKAAYWSLLRAT